jgi:hypothetical protein
MIFSNHQMQDSVSNPSLVSIIALAFMSLVFFLVCSIFANEIVLSIAKSFIAGNLYYPFEIAHRKYEFRQKFVVPLLQIFDSINNSNISDAQKATRFELRGAQFAQYTIFTPFNDHQMHALLPPDHNRLKDEVDQKVRKLTNDFRNKRRPTNFSLSAGSFTHFYRSDVSAIVSIPLFCVIFVCPINCVPVAALALALANTTAFLVKWSKIALDTYKHLNRHENRIAALPPDEQRNVLLKRGQYYWFEIRVFFVVAVMLLISYALFVVMFVTRKDGTRLVDIERFISLDAFSPSTRPSIIVANEFYDLRSVAPAAEQFEQAVVLIASDSFPSMLTIVFDCSARGALPTFVNVMLAVVDAHFLRETITLSLRDGPSLWNFIGTCLLALRVFEHVDRHFRWGFLKPENGQPEEQPQLLVVDDVSVVKLLDKMTPAFVKSILKYRRLKAKARDEAEAMQRHAEEIARSGLTRQQNEQPRAQRDLSVSSEMSDEDLCCCICLVNIDPRSGEGRVTPCHHFYHEYCLDQWVRTARQPVILCPCCSKPIMSNV